MAPPGDMVEDMDFEEHCLYNMIEDMALGAGRGMNPEQKEEFGRIALATD